MAVMGLPSSGIWLRLLRQVQEEPFRCAAHEERLQAVKNAGRSRRSALGSRPKRLAERTRAALRESSARYRRVQPGREVPARRLTRALPTVRQKRWFQLHA